MKEVKENLFVGNGQDYDSLKNDMAWSFVQAAKEPWHRNALGYAGRAAPKDHKEYLIVQRENRLILNMVDADVPDYFSPELFIAACRFIERELAKGKKVLVHCNQGESRGPAVALVFLAGIGEFGNCDYKGAKAQFEKLYPFKPKNGVDKFLEKSWETLFE